MATHRPVLLMLCLASLAACAPEPLHSDGVNLVLGDESLRARFGDAVPEDLAEEDRVRIHLEYVLERLRQQPTAHLSPALRAARARQLERLAAYVRQGVFPRNDDHPDARRPTFIDSRGRRCAVGALLEQDLGPEAVEALAARSKYAFIREIDAPVLTRWAATSGLEREELELIQPSYSTSRELEETHGLLFTSLERFDAGGHLGLSTAWLLDDPGEGVPLRLDLSIAIPVLPLDPGTRPEHHRPQQGGGGYAKLALTKLTGAARSASALGNLDVGVYFAHVIPLIDGWWIARAGLLLPTGDEDRVGAPLNRSVAALRATDAVLFQPGALGGRTSVSLLMRMPCEGCALRVDTGVDVYTPTRGAWQLSPRWGVGFGVDTDRSVTTTLEYTGTLQPETPGAAPTLHHALGGSVRLHSRPWSGVRPGLSLFVPLGDASRSWFLGLDAIVRFAL